MTVFLYLNDVEEGGGTEFHYYNITVQPKRGRALIWPSVKDEDPDEQDPRTEHAALPVIKGVKYGANGKCCRDGECHFVCCVSHRHPLPLCFLYHCSLDPPTRFQEPIQEWLQLGKSKDNVAYHHMFTLPLRILNGDSCGGAHCVLQRRNHMKPGMQQSLCFLSKRPRWTQVTRIAQRSQ